MWWSKICGELKQILYQYRITPTEFSGWIPIQWILEHTQVKSHIYNFHPKYAYKSADKTKTVFSERNRTGISYRSEIEPNNTVTLSNTNGKNCSSTKSKFV